MSSNYTWYNSTKVTHFLNPRFLRNLMVRKLIAFHFSYLINLIEYYIIFFSTFFRSPNEFISNLAQKHILNVLELFMVICIALFVTVKQNPVVEA